MQRDQGGKRLSKVDKLERNVGAFLERQAGPDLAYWNKQLGYDGPSDYKVPTRSPKPFALPAQAPIKVPSGSIELTPKSSDCPCIIAAKAACSSPHLATSWDKFCTCDVPSVQDEVNAREAGILGSKQASKPSLAKKKGSLANKGSVGAAAPSTQRENGGRLSTQADPQTRNLTSAVGLDLNKYSEAGVDVMIRPVRGPPPKDPAQNKKGKVLAEPVDLTLVPKGLTAEELLSRGGRRDTILILRPPTDPQMSIQPQPEPTEPPKVEKVQEAPLELVIRFMEAVMTKKYEAALKDAHAILELEPKNDLVKAYCPVLEQLIDLENSEGSDSFCSDESSDDSSGNSGNSVSETETEAGSETEGEEGPSESSTSSSSAASSTGSMSSVSSVLTDEYASEYEDSDELERNDDGYGTDSGAFGLMPNFSDDPERLRVLQRVWDEQLPPIPSPTPEPVAALPTTPLRKHGQKKKLSVRKPK